MTQQSNTPATMQQFNFFNPEQLATMQRVANMFATSELVPDMYRITDNNPKEKAISNCVIAIDIANRIQANILMVMQNLVIIYGRPSWSSKFLIATVNTCGRFEPLKYRFENLGTLKGYEYQEYENTWENGKKKTNLVKKTIPGPIDNLQCIAYTTAKGSDDVLESPPVSVEMAINEGWYTKKGSKWPSMTRLMLTYRAASFWTSTYAPELSMGMKTEDEIRDIVDTDFEDVTDKVVKKAEQEIKEKANKKEMDLTPEPEQQPEPQKPAQLEKMKFGSREEAESFFAKNYEIPYANMIREKLFEVAKANGIELVIEKKQADPGF